MGRNQTTGAGAPNDPPTDEELAALKVEADAKAARDAAASEAEEARLRAETEERQAHVARNDDARKAADAQALAEAEARQAHRARLDDERIEVRTSLPHRRRANMTFTAVPTLIEPGAITKMQRHAIDSDPHLSVRILD